MKLLSAIRTYCRAFSARGTYLVAIGLVPIFLALAFVLCSHIAPTGAAYGPLWLARSYAFWVDSIGLSLLLLVGGAAILDYAEKHDPPKTE